MGRIWQQQFGYWWAILRTISFANAYSNTNCNRNCHADRDANPNAIHGKMCANAEAASTSGASALVLDVRCKPKVPATLYGCHDLAIVIQALR